MKEKVFIITEIYKYLEKYLKKLQCFYWLEKGKNEFEQFPDHIIL